ncbi:EscR/YscR/HrcR family type III secretion system export apparatus protein [Agaricicola taiwanensis]|uniref:EscR/YscR/HrcR family type III secretion system export apparatus protein n=1 Tax=Agaricicola taiwanensis TaxID=591372 RepID=A0A8J2VPH2_9RHOB|nr:type III secretion system export apparatus subunit SctR [Agaricicola taiwanensis]GGE35930.1 EscR/YscR/HrcR family type III secretion system export apparatus protein [Agaricicola taiwanensis]
MGGDQTINFTGLILLTSALALVPFLVVTMTAFLKLSVVLIIIRNALGIQQAPPNLVIYAIAFILTVYVSAPILTDIQNRLVAQPISLESVDGWMAAAEQVKEPVQAHLARYAEPRHRSFFAQATASIWPAEAHENVSEDDFVILLPSFIASELTRAFEIGFLLYLPFLVIDLVVSNVLMAMGMMMVQPTLISIPLKLLLFVSIDGWTRLMQGLVLSYG